MQTLRFMPKPVFRAPLLAFGWLWAASVLLPLAAFIWIAADSWRRIEVDALGRLNRVGDMLSEDTLRSFEIQEALLTAAARYIQRTGWAEADATAEIHTFLTILDETTPSTAGMALLSPEGILVAASRILPPVQPVDQSARASVRANQNSGTSQFTAASGSYISEVLLSPLSEGNVFTFSRTIGNAGAPDQGVIVTSFYPERFTNFYQRILESAGDAVTLSRTDGALLARFPLPTNPVGLFAPPDSIVMQAFRASPTGSGIIEAVSRIDGVRRIVVFRRVPDYPVFVAYALDTRVLVTAWRARLLIPGLIALGAVALLLAATAHARKVTADRLGAEKAKTAIEAKLRQLERVSAFGELAASVAHDFRNAAQVMASCARLLDRAADEPARVREYSAMIDSSATMVASLTNRMLNVVRRRSVEEEVGVLDLPPAMSSLADLLSRTIGSKHTVTFRRNGLVPGTVAADQSEFEAAVVNLVVNARDAMPQGGDVILTVGCATDGMLRPVNLPAGPFVVITVIDHGLGMDPSTLARAGEPFFTTKTDDRGTGLGLAGARGFAERAGGMLTIASKVGQGTTVTIWLPVQQAAQKPASDRPFKEIQVTGP